MMGLSVSAAFNVDPGRVGTRAVSQDFHTFIMFGTEVSTLTYEAVVSAG